MAEHVMVNSSEFTGIDIKKLHSVSCYVGKSFTGESKSLWKTKAVKLLLMDQIMTHQ